MKTTDFYALWVTRNGQHLWSGPHPTREQAQASLDATMECTGKRIAEVPDACPAVGPPRVGDRVRVIPDGEPPFEGRACRRTSTGWDVTRAATDLPEWFPEECVYRLERNA